MAKFFLDADYPDAAGDVEEYLSAAVEQGHPQACLLLARKKWDQDPERAVELLGNAADCALPEAMELLGECYAAGHGVEQDPAKAEEWFCKAAEAGGPEEKLALAIRYRRGDGVAQSRVRAMAWLNRAKKAGAENAQERFDAAKSEIEELVAQAEAGDAGAQNQLGYEY